MALSLLPRDDALDAALLTDVAEAKPTIHERQSPTAIIPLVVIFDLMLFSCLHLNVFLCKNRFGLEMSEDRDFTFWKTRMNATILSSATDGVLSQLVFAEAIRCLLKRELSIAKECRWHAVTQSNRANHCVHTSNFC